MYYVRYVSQLSSCFYPSLFSVCHLLLTVISPIASQQIVQYPSLYRVLHRIFIAFIYVVVSDLLVVTVLLLLLSFRSCNLQHKTLIPNDSKVHHTIEYTSVSVIHLLLFSPHNNTIKSKLLLLSSLHHHLLPPRPHYPHRR